MRIAGLLLLVMLAACSRASGASDVSSVRDLAHAVGCSHLKMVEHGPVVEQSATCRLGKATLVLDYIGDPDQMGAYEESIGGQRELFGKDWAVYSLRSVLLKLQSKVGGEIRPEIGM